MTSIRYICTLISVIQCSLIVNSTALSCKQCYSMILRNQTNLEHSTAMIIPSLYNGQCQPTVRGTTTVDPRFAGSNESPELLMPCPSLAIMGTNMEDRCGYYTGDIVVKGHQGQGEATLRIMSMTCFTEDINVPYGCAVREYPMAGDQLHFNTILNQKFKGTLTLNRFQGNVCYCRSPDCSDISAAHSMKSHQIIFLVLLLNVLNYFKKIF